MVTALRDMKDKKKSGGHKVRKTFKSLINLEMFFLLFVVYFSVSFFVGTFNYNRTAGLFPRIMSVVILAFSALYLMQKVVGAVKEARAAVKAPETKTEGLPWYIPLSMMFAYLLLIHYFGFSLATFCYAIAMPLISKYRKMGIVIAFSIGMVIVIVYGFGFFFRIPLPRDIIVDTFNLRMYW